MVRREHNRRASARTKFSSLLRPRRLPPLPFLRPTSLASNPGRTPTSRIERRPLPTVRSASGPTPPAVTRRISRERDFARRSPVRARARAARHRAVVQGMAAGGGAAHADEQPRPRRGGALGGPGGLRRLGQGGAELGGIPPDRRVAPLARVRRDAAGPVRQARGHLPHPPRRAARAHCQRHAGAGVGRLGALPQVRGSRAHHVRADDGGLVDLHRHAGHPPGDLRDLCGVRRKALRRDRWPAGSCSRRGSAGWAAPSPSPSP